MGSNSFLKALAAGTLGLACLFGCAARSAQAGDHCFYKGTMFSDGSANCQSGTQYRCRSLQR